MATYTVKLWGSNPGTNDDCWTEGEYPTLAQARVAYEEPFDSGEFPMRYNDSHEPLWIEMTGEGIHEVRCIWTGTRTPSRDSGFDREWQSEIAMQAGMGLGIDAYNDEMMMTWARRYDDLNGAPENDADC